MSTHYRLDAGVSLAVLASAGTEAAHHEDLGCSVQGPTGRALRAAIAPLEARVAKLGRERSVREAPELIRWLESTPRYDALCRGKATRLGRRLLREEVLFPDPKKTRPRFLHLRKDGLGLDFAVRAQEWPMISALFSNLGAGASTSYLETISRTVPAIGELLEDLWSAGWIREAQRSPVRKLKRPGLLYVGHNAVLVDSGSARILIDPYFRPASSADTAYRPMQPYDVGRVDAIAITHSHGDHYHLGSLLQFPPETRIFVPPVERESIYATDMVLRLRELGFTNVEPLAWWSTRRIGDLELQAPPFHGEQPTDHEGVYPALRNVGSTWVVRHPKLSAAFYADTGHDAWGDMREVSRKVREMGPVDFLFTGIRGFRLKPIFYGSTTLKNFLADVPFELLGTPQQLMADATQALDYGELLGAKYVVPSADGGGPWFWREGMGPYYPGYPSAGAVHPPETSAHENPDADPYPERLVEERERRGTGPEALVLRPGDAVQLLDREPEVQRFRGFTWPFGERR